MGEWMSNSERSRQHRAKERMRVRGLERKAALGKKLAQEVVDATHAQSSGERALQLARELLAVGEKQGGE